MTKDNLHLFLAKLCLALWNHGAMFHNIKEGCNKQYIFQISFSQSPSSLIYSLFGTKAKGCLIICNQDNL